MQLCFISDRNREKRTHLPHPHPLFLLLSLVVIRISRSTTSLIKRSPPPPAPCHDAHLRVLQGRLATSPSISPSKTKNDQMPCPSKLHPSREPAPFLNPKPFPRSRGKDRVMGGRARVGSEDMASGARSIHAEQSSGATAATSSQHTIALSPRGPRAPRHATLAAAEPVRQTRRGDCLPACSGRGA